MLTLRCQIWSLLTQLLAAGRLHLVRIRVSSLPRQTVPVFGRAAFVSALFACTALPALTPLPAFAVDPAPPAAPIAPVAQTDVSQTEQQRAARRAELDALTHDIEVTTERQAALRTEMDQLDQDRTTLNKSLIETGERARGLERQIDEAEQRMGGLLDEEKSVHTSLRARRGVLANVLGALQRMGRKPPPAIVVRPEDALASVRSAMLLGSVVPGPPRASPSWRLFDQT